MIEHVRKPRCYLAGPGAPDGVPYFFKQWGEHGPDGRRVGRRASGDLLDGVLHHEWPVNPPF